MELLINKNVASNILQIAIGLQESEFNKFVLESQKFDLKELFCDEFFNDFFKNLNEPKYQELVNGKEYAYNGHDYQFEGLKSVIAYFAYSRMLHVSNMVHTSRGTVTKTTPYSTPVDNELIRSQYYDNRKKANVLFSDIKKYIERFPDDYPLWNCDVACTSKNNSSKSIVIK